MENNYITELTKDDFGIIEEYRQKNKIHPDFLPFVTYDMVQCGYPTANHGEMIARNWGGSDKEGKLLPSKGMWCKVDDVKKLFEQHRIKFSNIRLKE